MRLPGPGSLAIAADVLAMVEAHAREVRPGECCGLLIGPRAGLRVTAARRAANLSSTPHRFELDPQAHVRALRETRGTPLDVVGFYHSHPRSAAFPSATDLAESSYPGAIHLIVGFPSDGEAVEVRGFLLHADGYDELALVLTST